MPDIPENVLIRLLLVLVKNHQKTTSNPATTDSEVGCPPLHVLLAACLNYPASSVPARAAIREHFKDAEDIYCLLEVLAEWLDYWCEEKLPLLHEGKEKRGKGRKKQETALPRGSTDTPELPSVSVNSQRSKFQKTDLKHRFSSSSKQSLTHPSSPSFSTPHPTHCSARFFRSYLLRLTTTNPSSNYADRSNHFRPRPRWMQVRKKIRRVA